MARSKTFTLKNVLPCLLAFACIGVVLAVGNAVALDSGSQPLGRDDPFVLVFDEDFDAPTLDRKRWTTCYWWDDGGCTNLSSGELQWYRPENVAIEDGRLVLTAREGNVVGAEGRKFGYTSGMVTTGRYYRERPSAGRFEATYGFFEMRAKVPAGQGLWPAFWMLPARQESLPEIDIMEVLGHDTGLLELHFHYRRSGGSRGSVAREVKTRPLSDGWHTYGLDWSPERLVWYLDGEEVWRYSEKSRIPDEPMYMIINLAVGGNWPGNPDNTTAFPARLEVDYVRVWQRP